VGQLHFDVRKRTLTIMSSRKTRNCEIQVDPVTRDHVFFYDSSSCLFVMLDGRRYPRADPQHLHRLLTWGVDTDPLLTKTSSVPPKPHSPHYHKDETATYYKAQLMHFGLKPFKTKPAAKKALLAAFGDGHDLKVPERLGKMEEELKNLWDAESEKVWIRYEQKEKVRRKKRETRLAELRRRHEAVLAEFDEQNIPLEAVPSRKRKATNDGDMGEKIARSSGSDMKVLWIHFLSLTVPLIARYSSFLLSMSRENMLSMRHISRKNGPTTPLAVSISRSLPPAVPVDIFGAASSLASSRASSAAARLRRPLVRRSRSSGEDMSRVRARWNMAQRTRGRSLSLSTARFVVLWKGVS
jgi:hypothetical protein